MDRSPDRHEGGSPNVVGAFALAAACRALARIGMGAVSAEEARLGDLLRERLARIPGVVTYQTWPGHPERVGIAAFSVDGRDHAEVATILSAEYGIGVRNGSFCAHPLLSHIAGGVEGWRPGCARTSPEPSAPASAWAAGTRTSIGSARRFSRSRPGGHAGSTAGSPMAGWCPIPTTGGCPPFSRRRLRRLSTRGGAAGQRRRGGWVSALRGGASAGQPAPGPDGGVTGRVYHQWTMSAQPGRRYLPTRRLYLDFGARNTCSCI